MRAEINGLPRKSHAPRPNLNKEESKALLELRRDKDRIILTAVKGEAIVVLDKKEYIEKAHNLLVQLAFRTIERDPTNKLKAKLITMLRIFERESGMEENVYKAIPQVALTLSFMVYPKFRKLALPSGLLYQVGAQSLMKWLKFLLRYFDH